MLDRVAPRHVGQVAEWLKAPVSKYGSPALAPPQDMLLRAGLFRVRCSQMIARKQDRALDGAAGGHFRYSQNFCGFVDFRGSAQRMRNGNPPSRPVPAGSFRGGGRGQMG